VSRASRGSQIGYQLSAISTLDGPAGARKAGGRAGL
jgi:hypothetical protein